MRRSHTIIIGGGQAGLAMSRSLTDAGLDHRVLERGRVGERWRSERWDSLRTLTPNWQSRLPGWSYRGDDPDGYMTMPEVVRYLEGYARSFDAPVQDETTVTSVRRTDAGFRVATDRGAFEAANVVIATGHADRPHVPAAARDLDPAIFQTVPTRYRNPDALPAGGVLVVGASASGLQIADELRRAGREVTLSVGPHTRLPRMYRGRDIMWWLDRTGILDERAERVRNLERSRNAPSLQLVGRPDHASIDLGTVADAGVRLAGQLSGTTGSTVHFDDDLAHNMGVADARLRRLLDRIDGHVDATAMTVGTPDRPNALAAPPTPDTLDLRDAGISTVLWATGFRRAYPWLEIPVTDRRGDLLHHGGVTPCPGLYALGFNFLRRRNSNYIDGVGADALALARHIRTHRTHDRPAA